MLGYLCEKHCVERMKQSPLEQQVTKIVAPVIEDLGFELVLVSFAGGALQIMVENPQTHRIGLEECSAISRAVSPALEVEDPIGGAYRLEVSSPGIDRPLVKAEDYRRFSGFEAKIEMDAPLDGQKRYRGLIKGEKDGFVLLETDQGDKELPLAAIQKAKLVMTDDLIEFSKEKLNEQQKHQQQDQTNEKV